MNAIRFESTAIVPAAVAALPSLVKRAADQLASATTAAEILDAREAASRIYDATKSAARFARAKQAHDDVISVVYRTQADALEIESMAKRRLADEYDAAQERGDIGKSGVRTDLVPKGNEVPPSAADAGLTRKAIHEARIIRDAEQADPGIVRRVLDEKIEAGQEPTKAALREGIKEAARQGRRTAPVGRNPLYQPPTEASAAWTHLYGTCRALSEWGTFENIELVKAGIAERLDDQSNNLEAVRECADLLNSFLESVDAQ